jgi:hypothetical protein
MIDLWFVAFNSLWLIGLSILLATVSWASWAASVRKARMADILMLPDARRVWGIGMALFCAGMAATGRAWWEYGLWGTLAVGSLVYVIGTSVAKARQKKGRIS